MSAPAALPRLDLHTYQSFLKISAYKKGRLNISDGLNIFRFHFLLCYCANHIYQPKASADAASNTQALVRTTSCMPCLRWRLNKRFTINTNKATKKAMRKMRPIMVQLFRPQSKATRKTPMSAVTGGVFGFILPPKHKTRRRIYLRSLPCVRLPLCRYPKQRMHG